MSDQNPNLAELLSEPRESLDIEIKQWLDLSQNDQRAHLAKEIIALANYGGGHIVIGLHEADDGTFGPAGGRPASLKDWSQDAIQSIIAKYIDPAIQCAVSAVTSSIDGNQYPIISVPGGHRMPVRAKAGSADGKLVANRIYIRRAGPNSEEPRTTEEWDRLLEKCLQNRKLELLDAMRSILAGVVPTAHQVTPSRIDQLKAFELSANERWEARVANLGPDEPPRFPNGYYDLSVALDGKFDIQTLAQLRRTITNSVRNHSGWPAFLTLDREPFAPVPVDGAIEFWRGPDTDGSFDVPAHHDFWRISPEGYFFTRRGYNEDGRYGDMEAGKFLDITTPIWRLGEAILQISYISKSLNATNVNLICNCRWTGLSGRRLVSQSSRSQMHILKHKMHQETYETIESISLDALPSSLPELVHGILAPMYELFEFYQLPKRLVETELASLQKNVFPH